MNYYEIKEDTMTFLGTDAEEAKAKRQKLEDERKKVEIYLAKQK